MGAMTTQAQPVTRPEVRIAERAGFCYGVRLAIDKAKHAREEGKDPVAIAKRGLDEQPSPLVRVPIGPDAINGNAADGNAASSGSGKDFSPLTMPDRRNRNTAHSTSHGLSRM